MKQERLRALLAQRGLAPADRLGQNFLIDPALLAAIPGDAGVQAGEPVLEVGPGAGSLSERLLAAGADVLAVELDRGLAAWLRERFAGEPRFRLVEGDVLGPGAAFHPEVEAWWPPRRPRLVANLPYGISGPFLGRLPGRFLAGACLLLQLEMAQRVVAAVGGADYGPLAVRLQLAFQARLGRRVPPEVFWPRPRVQSAFLHLQPRADAPSAAEDARLAALLRQAFGQRRKQVLARVREWSPPAAAALAAAGVSARQRAEQIPPETWRAAACAMV